MLTVSTDSTGQQWVDTDDHGHTRRSRWQRRTRARQIAYIIAPGRNKDEKSPLKRLKSCGTAKAPDVELRASNGHISAHGLMNCGNVWTCPTCAARIRTRREREIETALSAHCANGGQIGMLTLTLRHTRDMALAESIERLNESWRKIQRYHRFKPIHQALTGSIATLEITHGDNGWHPHLHILLLSRPDVTHAELDHLTNRLRRSWSNLVNSLTDVFSLRHGLDLTWFGRDSAAAAKYVAKLAKEMTLSDTKSGNDPFNLLDDTSAESTALFIEYANATYRRQMHRWSNGLKRALVNADELSDDEINDDNQTTGDLVLVISREHWNHLSENDRLAYIEFAEALHQLSGP